MTTTLTLDDDVFAAAQAEAKASGKKLDEVVSDLIRRGLGNSPSVIMENGMPVFKLPPGAPMIPAGRAKEINDNEPW